MVYRAAIRASLAAGGACLAAIPAAAQNPPKVEHGPPPIPPIPTELMKRPDEPRKPKPVVAPPAPKPVLHPVLEDVVMGSADATVEIIEYASMTCAACQHFHAKVLPELAAGYVLAGDAKFILRDYPTAPMPAATAAAALARCTGPTAYYDTVAELFTRQTEILSAARIGELTGVLEMIGGNHGLSVAEVRSCVEDPATLGYIRAEAQRAPVSTNPPVLMINGVALNDLSIESVRRAIDRAIEADRLAHAPPPPAQITQVPEPAPGGPRN